jgi:hypothetical protein
MDCLSKEEDRVTVNKTTRNNKENSSSLFLSYSRMKESEASNVLALLCTYHLNS